MCTRYYCHSARYIPLSLLLTIHQCIPIQWEISVFPRRCSNIQIGGSFADRKSRESSCVARGISRRYRHYRWTNERTRTDGNLPRRICRPAVKLFRVQFRTVEVDGATTTIASLLRKVWRTTSSLTGHSSLDYLYVFCPRGAYTRLEANIRGRHGANIRGRLRLRL